jgi:hypothetical protein
MENGHLSLVSVSDDAPGLATQGFSTFGSGKISFATEAGDGVGPGVGTCASASEYCATVDATNNTGRLMDNVFVELTKYVTLTPAGAKVSLLTDAEAALSNAFKSVFAAGTQAAGYGSFTVGQMKPLEMKWNLAAGSPVATNFVFQARVLASFRRRDYNDNGVVHPDTTLGPIDACTMTGHTTQLTNSDDGEATVALPFPFTLYDTTCDQAVIGANGYLLPFLTGSATPTVGASSFANVNMPGTAGPPAGFYLFWDDLKTTATGVCTALTGSKPARLFYVTWHANISTNQPTRPATFSSEAVTFSIRMQETADQFSVSYSLPTGGAGVTNFTRGIGATIGERHLLNGVAGGVKYSFNAMPTFLPADPAQYPSRFTKTGIDFNP